jgi:hypothetical protein
MLASLDHFFQLRLELFLLLQFGSKIIHFYFDFCFRGPQIQTQFCGSVQLLNKVSGYPVKRETDFLDGFELLAIDNMFFFDSEEVPNASSNDFNERNKKGEY